MVPDLAQQPVLVHGLDEGRQVGPIQVARGVLPAGGEEVRAPPLQRAMAGLGARAVLDVVVGHEVHVEEVEVVFGERVDDAFVDRARDEGLLVGGLRLGALPLEALHLGEVQGHAEQAQPPARVVELELGGLELARVARGVRHVLHDDDGLVPRQRPAVILREVRGDLLVEDLEVGEAHDPLGRGLVGEFGEGLVAGQVHAGLGVFGEAHRGHVV